MFNSYSNSYLQLQLGNVNPRLVNRAVNNALGLPTSGFDKDPPLLRLCSEQPCIPVENIDPTRAQVAAGRWALPKLYKELHSKNWTTKLQAINTVCDLVRDPEKSFEAIRLNFIDRYLKLPSTPMAVNTLRCIWKKGLKFPDYDHVRKAYLQPTNVKRVLHFKANLLISDNLRLIRDLITYPDFQNEDYQERVLLALQYLAEQAQGRDMMLANRNFTSHLKKILTFEESANIRCKVAAIIKNLTDSVTARWTLIDDGYVNLLIRKAHKEPITDIAVMYLVSLEKLLIETEAQEIGFESDAVERLVDVIERNDTELVTQAGRCLSLLISHPFGKNLSLDMNLLDKLNDLLHDTRREVYMTAAQILMFATHKVRSKHDAARLSSIATRLLDLANDFNCPAVQMFAIKALTNICEHPHMRELFLENYMDRVKSITTDGNPELQHFKTTLIKVIEWKPWIGYI